jgi:hypothetical protein
MIRGRDPRSRTRARKRASDDEYLLPGDDKKTWEKTSRWRPIQLETLRIIFEDGSMSDIIGNIDIEDIQLYPDVNRVLLDGVDVGIGCKLTAADLPREQRMFFDRLSQLAVFNDEPPVDSVAYDLLSYTGFEGGMLHF